MILLYLSFYEPKRKTIILPLFLRELSRNTTYVDEHLVKKGWGYCVKILPHSKYCKKKVGGYGKKKEEEEKKRII